MRTINRFLIINFLNTAPTPEPTGEPSSEPEPTSEPASEPEPDSKGRDFFS